MSCFNNYKSTVIEYRNIIGEQSELIEKQKNQIKEMESEMESLKEACKNNSKFEDYFKFYVKDRKKYDKIFDEVNRILDKYKC